MRMTTRAPQRRGRYVLTLTAVDGLEATRRFMDADTAWAIGLDWLRGEQGAAAVLADKGDRVLKMAFASRVLDKISEEKRASGTRIPEGMLWEVGA